MQELGSSAISVLEFLTDCGRIPISPKEWDKFWNSLSIREKQDYTHQARHMMTLR